MTETCQSAKPVSVLAAQWHIFAFWLISCMRTVRWLEDARSARALARAETLEACLHVCLLELTREIERCERSLPKALSKEEAHALAHLRLIARSIAAFLMMLQHMKLRIQINAERPVWMIYPKTLGLGTPAVRAQDPKYPP